MIFKKILIVLIVLLFSISVVEALDKSRVEIGANKINELGITGKRNTICLIDDGVDYTNEYLGGCTTPQYQAGNCPTIIAGRNIRDGNTNILPKTNQDHGTHVAGILISSHPNYKGIAPDAKLAVVKVYSDVDDTSSCQGFVDAINWCISNSDQYNISVISLSYGLNVCEASYTSQFQSSINNATAYGISFIKSSGNTLTPSSSIMTFPAQLGNVTTVGSTTGNSVSDFTRRLPTSKLDLLAPGHKIRSTNNGGGLSPFLKNIICSTDPPFDPGSFLYNLTICDSGTSYATPHVAASAALLKEFDPALKPFDIEQILKGDGDKIYDSVTNTNFTKINLLKALHVLDWPTVNHDYRRTGFTLLKGDLQESNKVTNRLNFFLDAATGTEQVVKPSIADMDGDELMDQIIMVHKTSFNTFTNMYGLETGNFFSSFPRRIWNNPVQINGGAIYFPATLANIDSDREKEIITGTRNGTVYAYEVNGNQVTQKWVFRIPQKFSPLKGIDETMFNGGSAVADIDLDGSNEVIFADVSEAVGDGSFPGEVYVLYGNNGSNKTSYIFGNGGAYDAVSVANVDSDDYPEVVVAARYGIKVLDYNPSTNQLTEKPGCSSNSDGLIEGSAVIYDVDKDNEYEIIYVTTERACASGKTCSNKLYIRNASSCTPEKSVSFSEFTRATPTVANLDSDSQMEIIVSSEVTVPNGLGNITAIDSSTGNVQWTYNAEGTLHPGAISPNTADIDNDGNYNIILGENTGSTVYVLDHNGNKKDFYPVVGFMDNGLAIADIDKDGMGEIVFKRAASPETVQVAISATNTQPQITKISNATAIAGDLINISQLISSSDAEGNGVSLLYSSPFNSSGQWQTTINDTGNYSILVEASDGNLSISQFIDVIVFNGTNTKLQNQFSDGTAQKLLNFTEPGNLTVKVRLPKNATVIYSKLKITGLAP